MGDANPLCVSCGDRRSRHRPECGRCGCPAFKSNSWRCRLGFHNWSGYTWPIMTRVCFRCGAR